MRLDLIFFVCLSDQHIYILDEPVQEICGEKEMQSGNQEWAPIRLNGHIHV